MAEEPDNMVLVILREIRAKLDQQGEKIDELVRDVRGLKGRSIYALGVAGNAEFDASSASEAADRALKRIDQLIEMLRQRDIDVDA